MLRSSYGRYRRRIEAVLRSRRLRRRLWCGNGSVHVELRDLDPEDARRFASVVERELGRLPGIKWARVNAGLGRLVVALDPEASTDALVSRIREIEAGLGIEGEPFPTRQPEGYPGDREPVLRTAAELVAETAGLAGGAILRRLGVKPLPIEIDLAALVAVAEGIPAVRRAIDRALSIALAEIAIDVARAALHALLEETLGPAAGIVVRGLRLRELQARQRLWRAIEPELCGDPNCHVTPPAPAAARPQPLPPGPIERYSAKAELGTLGGFATIMGVTGQISAAAASIFGGLPKPALHGREAFAAHLGTRLADRGVLVLEPGGLRRLDRIDTVVVDAASLCGVGDVPRFVAALETIEEAGIRLVVATDEPDAWPGTTAIGAGEALPGALREQQRRGRGVCLIAAGPSRGFGVADFGVGLLAAGEPPPWRAHVICRGGLADAAMIADAVAPARAASHQGVALSAVEAAFGLALTLYGLRSKTTRRIMDATSGTSLLAIGNGVRLAHSIERRAAVAVAPAAPWHAMAVAEVLGDLGTTLDGLDAARAAARRRPTPEPRPLARLGRVVGSEILTPMTGVLVAGAGLAAVFGSPADSALIASVVVINGVVSGIQRFRIERALRRLDSDERRPIKVRRGGRVESIDPAALVPGDVIELEAGEVIPADCRIAEARGLEVDESSLTGESLPVAKGAAPVEAAAIADRRSMLYQQTAVAAGTASAVVVAVGDDTEARRAALAAAEPPPTGVEARLQSLTNVTIPAAVLGGLAAGAASTLRGQSPRDAFDTMVSLAVAAVPEGLPLLATMAQLAAADRLATRGVLVRNSRAVEGLGRVDVLCADKTGTLTEGRIELAVVSDGDIAQPLEQLDERHLAILAAALRASPSSNGGALRLPHLTDRALVEGARRAGARSHDEGSGWQRLHELPFEPRRGFSAGLARHGGELLLSVKGAPEVVLHRCGLCRRGAELAPLSPERRGELLAESVRLADDGLRVLAVAERTASDPGAIDDDRVRGLVFCGLVGMADPVRGTAAAAIAELKRAGVDVIMVTGDHPRTAERIAREVGIVDGRGVLSGGELSELDDAQLDRRISEVSVFSRVSPQQKLRIVEALQRAGRVVAMTGDGANDAPAIRLADVGIALGRSSTAAARHAADLVVTDERIETLVRAVLEGRGLWSSVRDAVSLLVGGNLGEIAFTTLGALVAGRTPLNARQLLLLNLVTDSVPALALALRPPRASADALLAAGPEASLGRALLGDVTWRAGLTSGSAALAYAMARLGGRARAGTVGLVALSASQLGQTLVAGGRSKVTVAASLGSLAALLAIVETPGVSHFFGCRPLGPLGLAQAGVSAGLASGLAAIGPRLPGLLRRGQ